MFAGKQPDKKPIDNGIDMNRLLRDRYIYMHILTDYWDR